MGYAKPLAGGPGPASYDAHAQRILNELDSLIDWANTNEVRLLLGEIGWPNTSPYANPADDPEPWNALAEAYIARAKSEGIWLAQWNAGETQLYHKLGVYSVDPDSTHIAPLSFVCDQAEVFEGTADNDNWKYGLNLSGGEYGSQPGSTFSWSRTYDDLYTGYGHVDLPFSYAWNYGSEQTWQFLGSRPRKPSFVRLCFKMERVYPTLGGALDATELARIDQAISWATAEGIPVLLDCHNSGTYNLGGVMESIGGATVTEAHFADFWSKMTDHFKTNAGVLGHGLMNEPVYATDWIESLSQAAVDAIRAAGGTKYIFVAGDSGIGQLIATEPWITDPLDKVFYEGHHYWDDGSSMYDDTYAEYVIQDS